MTSITSASTSNSRSLLPAWLKGPWGFLGIIFILYTLLNLAWTYFHWGGEQNVVLIANLLSLPPSLLASIVAWRVAAQTSLSPPIRRAWLILGWSFFMFLLGNLIWAYLELVLQVEPFPSLADVFYLAFYPLGLWGLLSMPSSATQSWRERLTLWSDLLCVLTAAAMFVGYFIIVPTAAASGNDLLTQLIAPAYPIGSLLLTGGILAILYRPASPNTQSALSLLLIGMLFFVGGDFAFGYGSLSSTYASGGWTDASWNVAQLFFALAALRKMSQSPASDLTRSWISTTSRLLQWLPMAAIALAYGLVFYVVIVNDIQTAVWLIDGALLLTLLVVTRQIISPAFADLPVRVKMILTFILVSVLSVILVFAMAFLTIRSNLEAVVGDKLKADVEFRAQTLGNEVSKQIDLLEGFVLGETIEYGVTESNAQYTEHQTAIELQLLEQGVLTNSMARELDDFRYNFPDHSNLLLTNQYGRTIAATTQPDHYSQVSEEWWQSAYNHGRGAIYIGQPTVDAATQDLQVIIAVPVQADHTEDVVGVIRTTFHIQNILEMLTPPHLETQVGFNLLLPDGQLLRPEGSTQSLEPDVIAYLQSDQGLAYTTINFEGKSHLISKAPMVSSDPEDSEAFQALNWTLMSDEESAAAFAPLFAASRTTLLTLLFVLFLTSGVASILAQILIAPISRLTRVAAKIAAGDLTTQARVESQDEIGKLAGTFNTMVQALSQTRQELQDSEALYRSLVDYSPDMIAVHGREGRTLFINPAGVKMMGAQSAEEILSRPIMDMVPMDDRAEAQRGMENALAGEPTPLLQEKMHRMDGSSFEAEFRAIPISYAGKPAIQFVMRDVTERKRLEEQWQKFKLGIEQSHDAVFMTDVDGTIRYINPAFEKLYGYFWDETIGQTPRILKSGTLSLDIYRHFWETLLARGSTRGELVNRAKDGRLINIEASANPILDGQGNLIGFLAVQRDITERKRAEEQIHQLLAQIEHQNNELENRVAQRTQELNALNLRLQDELVQRQQLMQSLSESEARFRLLFEASPDAILLIDPNDPNISWPIVDCNEVACAMNGYSCEQLIGQSIDILNANPGIPTEREDYLKRVREKGVLHYEVLHRNKAGQLFPVEVSTSLITFEGRELILGIDRDITERKQTESALQQAKEIAEAASRAKSEFLSRMSHELRTPMNAILGFAQLLNMSRKEPLTSIQKERVRQITKGGQHLLDLINEILDISRIEAGRLQISPEPVPLRESIQEVLDLSAPLAANRNILIQTSLEMKENPFVMADHQRLKQVLLNLLSNAVKYNYDGGYVMVSCEQTASGCWRISVTDTGSGISSENLGRLFTPFERLSADQSNVEGTGLGLALAKRLVELMGGRIGVESMVGRGSTFWIELPLAESQLSVLQRTGGTGQLPVFSTAARTILYVEDNVANFELIQQVLADYSHIELLWAADPQTGIESARLHHPSLILLDLHLGGRDGADLLKQLKQDVETASIPVIMVSADATHRQIERLIALGAHSYLTKPLDVKLFMQLIEDLLSEKVN